MNEITCETHDTLLDLDEWLLTARLESSITQLNEVARTSHVSENAETMQRALSLE